MNQSMSLGHNIFTNFSIVISTEAKLSISREEEVLLLKILETTIVYLEKS